MSSHLSLTGLLPSAKKSVSRKPSLDHRHQQQLSRRPTAMAITNIGSGGCGTTITAYTTAAMTGIRAITNKAPLTIRPFAAIYNPYSKSCSVLCNHPATPEVKNVVKHAKQSWKHEPGHHHHHHNHHPDNQLQHRTTSPGHVVAGRSSADGGGVKHDVTKYGPGKLIKIMEYDDVNEVPEEFLRRFTDTDSRPMTPTPTVLSNKTRASHHSSSVVRSRRCFTPEPQNVYAREKKSIILDLRRSHSQETVFWNASSEFSAGHDTAGLGGSTSGSCRRPKTAAMTKELIMGGSGKGAGGVEKKTAKRNEATGSAAAAVAVGKAEQTIGSASSPGTSLKPQTRGASANSQSHYQGLADGGSEVGEQLNQLQKQLSCINSKDDLDEEPRRRGKKKKRGKGHAETSTTFRPSQDPETQVATVPPDSTTQSQRPSIVANGGSSAMLGNAAAERQAPRGSKTSSEDFREALGRMSFLDESLLSQLRRGLSIEAIETNFQIMMQRALREAFKGVPFEMMNSGGSGAGSSAVHGRAGGGGGGVRGGTTGSSPMSAGAGGRGGGRTASATEPDSVRGVKEALNLPHINHDKWLTLPRKYTRMVSRFELPIDSTELSHLSPVQYLSKYVQVSNYRKQLYHRIFVMYIPEIKLDDFGEINLPDWNSSSSSSGVVRLSTITGSGNVQSSSTNLINHGISTSRAEPPPLSTSSPSATTDGPLPISELYMNKRFIPLDQLRAALTTVLCPSASTEIIENVLAMLLLSDNDRRRRQQHQRRMNEATSDDATEKYHHYRSSSSSYSGGGGKRDAEGLKARVDEIHRNSSAAAERDRNGITINMSASPSHRSASDYVPASDVLQINRAADGRNGKLNIFHGEEQQDHERINNNSSGGWNASRRLLDGRIDSDKASNDCNGNVLRVVGGQTSFAGTAARIAATSSAAAQFATRNVSATKTTMKTGDGSSTTSSFSQTHDPLRVQGAEVAAVVGDEFLTEEIKINFRTWCGIVAFAERFTTNIQKENDTRHEIEITDFESLDRRINGLPIHPKLKQILYIIKN